VAARSLSQPEDDAFVRTAIRGMRPPEHEPSFWDRLAGELDAAEDARGVASVFGPPGSLEELPAPRPRARERTRSTHRAPEHPPRRAPLRATPSGEVAIDAPTAAVPAAAAAPAARAAAQLPVHPAPARPIPARVRAVDPMAGMRVRHDPSTLPASMRRASNVVLLTIALAAVLVALIAGLSLLRSRSDSGAPAGSPSAAAPAPSAQGDLTGGPVQTR
jgi:hypothetical protein